MPKFRPTILRIAIAAILTLTSAAAEAAPTTQLWEEVTGERVDSAQQTPDDNGLELTVRDGIVYLSVARATTVELFTILGQPVGRQSLRPGIYRLRLTTRGIYVLRAGGVTRRITL